MSLIPELQMGQPDNPRNASASLLARARVQWLLADWNSLAALQPRDLGESPGRGEIAMLSAVARMQLGQLAQAREWISYALNNGCSRSLGRQLLVSGIHGSLAKAWLATGLDAGRVKQHLHASLSARWTPPVTEAAVRSRGRGEMAQLPEKIRLKLDATPSSPCASQSQPVEDLLALAGAWEGAGLPDEADLMLGMACEAFPEHVPAKVAYAENAMLRDQPLLAIQRWQSLAAELGPDMTPAYYERLQLAYERTGGFPPGSPAEEQLYGQEDKHRLLAWIHQRLQPCSYLEIGVQTGKSLALAACRAIGVDPMPQIRFKLGEQAELVRAASDDFFAVEARSMLQIPPDLVFIDGMHLFEFALRDFINVERFASPHTLVVIDDIYPGHPAQAERDRRTRAWTGDVWKLLQVLSEERPDLYLFPLDAYPTGLLLIAGLNPENRSLETSYGRLVADYGREIPLPETVLKRDGALPCHSPGVEKMLDELRGARAAGVTTASLQECLLACRSQNIFGVVEK